MNNRSRRKAIRGRRHGMGAPEDLARELGVGLGLAYDLVRTGAVPSSRAGSRYLIAWETIAKIKSGDIIISMPRTA